MFYNDILGCPIGRSTEQWMDFDFFGNQISAHVSSGEISDAEKSEVDGKDVPLRHFGAILARDQWNLLAEKLKVSGIDFIIEPQIRFKGAPAEQHIMFFYDPSGNAIELKAFTKAEYVFR